MCVVMEMKLFKSLVAGVIATAFTHTNVLGCVPPQVNSAPINNLIVVTGSYMEFDGAAIGYYFVRPSDTLSTIASPIIFYIHGGGLTTDSGLIPGYQENARRIAYWTNSAVVILNYPLLVKSTPPANPFPAQFGALTCGERYILSQAATYNLDTDHIGVIGRSAGGYLATEWGLTPPGDPIFDTSQCRIAERLKHFKLILSYYGIYDLTASGDQGVNPFYYITPGEAVEASPISWVTANSPPLYMFRGQDDNNVPANQQDSMLTAYQAVGAPVMAFNIPDLGHAFSPTQYPPINVDEQESQCYMYSAIQTYLNANLRFDPTP